MTKLINLVGQKFGKLTVISRVKDMYGLTAWQCACDCGGKSTVPSHALRSGHTRSCGCGLKTHGKSRTRVYYAWVEIHRRCYDPRRHYYPRYGGRGIYVCERWHKFDNFFTDMGDPPDKRSLDRINNDGPYSPENCRWATHSEQQSNRTDTVLHTAFGFTGTVRALSRHFDIPHKNIHRRLWKGMTAQQAIEALLHKRVLD